MSFVTLSMVLVAVVLGIVAYLKDPPLLVSGLKVGSKTLWDLIPLLVAVFLVAGLAQVLIPKEFVSKWLGKESGFKGIMLGSIAGGLTPGGPFTSFPIAAALYKTGVGIGPLVAYISAWSLWAVGRLPFEIGLVGTKVTLIRLASTAIFPPLAGLIAQTFFSRIA